VGVLTVAPSARLFFKNAVFTLQTGGFHEKGTHLALTGAQKQNKTA
jgi:hypothetical protein